MTRSNHKSQPMFISIILHNSTLNCCISSYVYCSLVNKTVNTWNKKTFHVTVTKDSIHWKNIKYTTFNKCTFIYTLIYSYLCLFFIHTRMYFVVSIHCMSEKSWPNLCSNLLYKMGQDFLDRQYLIHRHFILYCNHSDHIIHHQN